ncbi:Peptide chain release factor class I/class II [Trinorchestia longiramus]|nr:Peptide chain release factor class I/class II [Trinorchestia longiramus]
MASIFMAGLRLAPPNARLLCTQHSLRDVFKSGVSLDKMYPKSSLNVARKVVAPSNETAFNGHIPLDKLKISYMCSSGPGGQHVNKVNTKVDIRFLLKEADWLPESLKKNIFEKHSHFLTPSGYIIVRSDKTRTQQLNLADALDKMRSLLHSSVEKPPVQPDHHTVEVMRRRHEKATRERLRQKRRMSEIKSFRGAQ